MIQNHVPGNNGMYNQPNTMQQFQVQGASGPSDWNNSIFGCLGNCDICLCAWCCPCIQYGRNKGRFMGVDSEGCCLYVLLSMCSLHICLGCSLRGKIRERYNIPGSSLGDCLCHTCCLPCALTQEGRELGERGAK